MKGGGSRPFTFTLSLKRKSKNILFWGRIFSMSDFSLESGGKGEPYRSNGQRDPHNHTIFMVTSFR